MLLMLIMSKLIFKLMVDVSIWNRPALDLAQPDYQTSLTTVTGTVNSDNGFATVNVEVNNGATATVKAQIVGNNSPRRKIHVVTYFWGDPNYDDDSSSGSGKRTESTTTTSPNTITISPLNIDWRAG